MAVQRKETRPEPRVMTAPPQTAEVQKQAAVAAPQAPPAKKAAAEKKSDAFVAAKSAGPKATSKDAALDGLVLARSSRSKNKSAVAVEPKNTGIAGHLLQNQKTSEPKNTGIAGNLPQNQPTAQHQQIAKDLGIANFGFGDILKLQPALESLGQAYGSAKKGDIKGALQHLGHAVVVLPEDLKDKGKMLVADQVLKNDSAKRFLGKVGIDTSRELVQTGNAAFGLVDVGKALFSKPPRLGDAVSGAGSVIKALPQDLKDKVEGSIWHAVPAPVRGFLNKSGISTLGDFAKLGPSIQDLGHAFHSAKEGHIKDALQSMGQAAIHLPAAMKDTLKTTVAEQILKNGTARDLLGKAGIDTPKEVVQAGEAAWKLTDVVKSLTQKPPSFKDAILGLGGVAGALPSDTKDKILGSVVNLLPQNARSAMDKAGFGQSDLVSLAGHGLDTVANMADAWQKGNFGDALKALGQGVQTMPSDLKGKLFGTAVEMLPVSDNVKGAIRSTGEMFSDPAVVHELAEAVNSLKTNPLNVGGFIGNLAEAVQKGVDGHHDAAANILDSIGKQGSGFGKFFSDPDLNKAFVNTGVVSNVFGAVDSLSHGDVKAAAGNLWDGIKNFATAGEKIKIGGFELPVSKEGLQNVGHLAGRVVDLLPTKVKDKVTGFLGSLGLGKLPILGDLFG